MSTIGWTNLNDAPTDPRPLTAAELDRYRRLHRVHVPDPAPAPRIPRQREVSIPGLLLLAALAACAAGFGWLAMAALF